MYILALSWVLGVHSFLGWSSLSLQRLRWIEEVCQLEPALSTFPMKTGPAVVRINSVGIPRQSAVLVVPPIAMQRQNVDNMAHRASKIVL